VNCAVPGFCTSTSFDVAHGTGSKKRECLLLLLLLPPPPLLLRCACQTRTASSAARRQGKSTRNGRVGPLTRLPVFNGLQCNRVGGGNRHRRTAGQSLHIRVVPSAAAAVSASRRPLRASTRRPLRPSINDILFDDALFVMPLANAIQFKINAEMHGDQKAHTESTRCAAGI
jgi:hypothetical protein